MTLNERLSELVIKLNKNGQYEDYVIVVEALGFVTLMQLQAEGTLKELNAK